MNVIAPPKKQLRALKGRGNLRPLLSLLLSRAPIVIPIPHCHSAQAGIHNTLSIFSSLVRTRQHSRFVDPRASAPLHPRMTEEGCSTRGRKEVRGSWKSGVIQRLNIVDDRGPLGDTHLTVFYLSRITVSYVLNAHTVNGHS